MTIWGWFLLAIGVECVFSSFLSKWPSHLVKSLSNFPVKLVSPPTMFLPPSIVFNTHVFTGTGVLILATVSSATAINTGNGGSLSWSFHFLGWGCSGGTLRLCHFYCHFWGISIEFSKTFILNCFTPFLYIFWLATPGLAFSSHTLKAKASSFLCTVWTSWKILRESIGLSMDHTESFGQWLVLSLGSYTEAGLNGSKWGHCERVFGLFFPSSASEPHEAKRLPVSRVPARCSI